MTAKLRSYLTRSSDVTFYNEFNKLFIPPIDLRTGVEKVGYYYSLMNLDYACSIEEAMADYGLTEEEAMANSAMEKDLSKGTKTYFTYTDKFGYPYAAMEDIDKSDEEKRNFKEFFINPLNLDMIAIYGTTDPAFADTSLYTGVYLDKDGKEWKYAITKFRKLANTDAENEPANTYPPPSREEVLKDIEVTIPDKPVLYHGLPVTLEQQERLKQNGIEIGDDGEFVVNMNADGTLDVDEVVIQALKRAQTIRNVVICILVLFAIGFFIAVIRKKKAIAAAKQRMIQNSANSGEQK